MPILDAASATANVELQFLQSRFAATATYIGRDRARDLFRVNEPIPQLGCFIIIKLEPLGDNSSNLLEWTAASESSRYVSAPLWLGRTEAFGVTVSALAMESPPTTAAAEYQNIFSRPLSPHALAYTVSLLVECTHIVASESLCGRSCANMLSDNVGLRVSYDEFLAQSIGPRSITPKGTGPTAADLHPNHWPLLGVTCLDAATFADDWGTPGVCQILDELIADVIIQYQVAAVADPSFIIASQYAQIKLASFFYRHVAAKGGPIDARMMARFRHVLASWYGFAARRMPWPITGSPTSGPASMGCKPMLGTGPLWESDGEPDWTSSASEEFPDEADEPVAESCRAAEGEEAELTAESWGMAEEPEAEDAWDPQAPGGGSGSIQVLGKMPCHLADVLQREQLLTRLRYAERAACTWLPSSLGTLKKTGWHGPAPCEPGPGAIIIKSKTQCWALGLN
jgi:hypothetical protein